MILLSHGKFDPLARTRLYGFHVSAMKIQKKNGQKAFLNEKFIQISFMPKKGIQFSLQGKQHASNLMEWKINFEEYLLTHAEEVLQEFCKLLGT